jgi:deoxyadenosine/deoxycytidine kinase
MLWLTFNFDTMKDRLAKRPRSYRNLTPNTWINFFNIF